MKAKSRVIATPAVAQEAATAETLAPLPKNKALTLARPALLQQLGNWLRGFVMVKKPVSGRQAAQVSVSQINTLRRQVAMMQKTLDKMVENSRT